MGNLFKRKRKGEKEPSPIWQMRYRVWDQQANARGRFKYESTHTTSEVEAASLLLDRERREERRKERARAVRRKESRARQGVDGVPRQDPGVGSRHA
jgi:hypothetical protein